MKNILKIDLTMKCTKYTILNRSKILYIISTKIEI